MNIDPTKIQKHIDNIDAQTAANLVSHVADAVVIMDQQGMVENVINTQTPGLNALQKLVGSYWIDHTAIDSKKKVAALVELENLWDNYLGGRFFDYGAKPSEFALLGGLATENVVKDEFDRFENVPDYFSDAVRTAKGFKDFSIRLVDSMKNYGSRRCWYNDEIISCLCTILRTAIKAGPMTGSIAVLGSTFLSSYSPGTVELDHIELKAEAVRRY